MVRGGGLNLVLLAFGSGPPISPTAISLQKSSPELNGDLQPTQT